MGEAFAARVAGSLLTALELPELITTAPAQYEPTAIDLARDPPRLGALREKLRANRLTTRLFDTPAFVRHLESACAAMYRRHRTGLAPAHLRIGPQEAPQAAQTFESGNDALRRFM
jgi:protein O-GlcNAc transferase